MCACVLLLHVVLGTAQCNFQANYLHQHYVAECQQHCWGSKYIFQMLHVHLARGARCCCLFNFFLFGIATSICGNAVLLHIYMIDQMCAHTHTHSYVHISQFVACVWSASSIVVACCTFRLTNECPPVGVARNTVSVSSVRQRQMSGYAWRATHQIQQQINAFNLFFRYLQRLRLFEIEEIISGATVHRPRRPLSAFVFVVVVVVFCCCRCCCRCTHPLWLLWMKIAAVHWRATGHLPGWTRIVCWVITPISLSFACLRMCPLGIAREISILKKISLHLYTNRCIPDMYVLAQT